MCDWQVAMSGEHHDDVPSFVFCDWCTDAQRSGVTAESVKNVAKARQMSMEEAEKILGIDSRMGYEEVLKVRRPLPCCEPGCHPAAVRAIPHECRLLACVLRQFGSASHDLHDE